MKVNKQKKIKVENSGFKRSKFNWSHDVNTTFGWGEVQPTQCKMLIPGSKTTMQAQNLIRLAPMVAPTFGRVKYKTYNQFVAMGEIFPNFDAMMAQEPKSTGYGTQVPQSVPTIKNGILSSWVLQGARATIYFALDTTDGKTAATNAAEGKYFTWYRTSPSDSSVPTGAATNWNHISSLFSQGTDRWNSASNGVLPNVAGTLVQIDKFGSGYNSVFGSNSYAVCLSNTLAVHLFPVAKGYEPQVATDLPIPDTQKEVTFESADYILEGVYQYDPNDATKVEYFALAVELGDFGKRIRKILQGCGYQINFVDATRVSILPLFAQYKAYFDIFGLELYQGWETTECAKMIRDIENRFLDNMDSRFMRGTTANIATINNSNNGIAFMMNELANEWYTDDVDYVSAHMSKLSVSPVMDSNGKQTFISVDQYGPLANLNEYPVAAAANLNADGTSPAQEELTTVGYSSDNAGATERINSIFHSQVDADMLKRMYRWVNRNSILGRKIADLLRAQGLGKYVDECKSNYIGSTECMITISDVVSQAATTDAVLGEYGGKGLQYDSTGTLVFENDEYGYWITLSCVVPEAGYTQGYDPTLTATTKFEFYQPDFDAIGMEMTPKQNVVGCSYIPKGNNALAGRSGFGFIPRYSKFKVSQNLVNGDFNRHALRNTYMPYTLDKQLSINDFDFENTIYDPNNIGGPISMNKIKKSVEVSNMPVAGNVWRYPTKYAWLGNFNRIFYNEGYRDDADATNAVNQIVGWSDYTNDNFLSHAIYDVNCYAPMKPIEDSYGIEEDENPIGSVDYKKKA